MSVTITEREQQAKSQEKPGHKNNRKVFIRQSLNCVLQAKLVTGEVAVPTASTRCRQYWHFHLFKSLVK